MRALGDLKPARAYLALELIPYQGNYRFTTDEDSVLPISLFTRH